MLFQRDQGELETARRAGLVEDARQVVFHGLQTDPQMCRDVAIRFALRDRPDDLDLARGEAVRPLLAVARAA
jgi:hypothetical protein